MQGGEDEEGRRSDAAAEPEQRVGGSQPATPDPSTSLPDGPTPAVERSTDTITAGEGDPVPSIFDAPPADTESALDAPPHPSVPDGPSLPPSSAKTPPPMVDPVAQPRPGASTWYRTDEERSKSVYRRANPWYRRIARGVIGLAFLSVAAIGLYAGARALQNWLERDQLPSAGAEVPEVRSTSFIVVSAAPGPTLDGTLTIDTDSSAFEFVGRAGGTQGGLQVVSIDGATVFLRQGASPWRAATSGDAVVSDVLTAVAYLSDDDSADDVLTNRLRRGFAELDAEVDEGSGDGRLVRYEMTFDTQGFARDFPLQWQQYQESAVPGAQEATAVPVTIWLDTDGVLMRVRDETANWTWERLTYSDQPFRPIDPANDPETRIVQVACVSDDNRIFWQTPLPSCDAAMTAARSAAADAGVTEAFDDLDRTIARTCSTMEREDGPLPATADEVALADALVEAGICRGDPTIFVVG